MKITVLHKIFILVIITIFLLGITACTSNRELDNTDKYSYSVSALFMLSTEVETGISMDASSIKYHDDYSNTFRELLDDDRIAAILKKYGFSDCNNIEIASANDTNTMYTVTFFSDEQETIVALGAEVCELLPNLILDEHNCVIKYVHTPTVDAIKKIK